MRATVFNLLLPKPNEVQISYYTTSRNYWTFIEYPNMPKYSEKILGSKDSSFNSMPLSPFWRYTMQVKSSYK